RWRPARCALPYLEERLLDGMEVMKPFAYGFVFERARVGGHCPPVHRVSPFLVREKVSQTIKHRESILHEALASGGLRFREEQQQPDLDEPASSCPSKECEMRDRPPSSGQ